MSSSVLPHFQPLYRATFFCILPFLEPNFQLAYSVYFLLELHKTDHMLEDIKSSEGLRSTKPLINKIQRVLTVVFLWKISIQSDQVQ